MLESKFYTHNLNIQWKHIVIFELAEFDMPITKRDLGVFEKCLVYFRRPYARYFRENGEKK